MISVENQFYFSVSVRSIKDFIDPEDLIRFAIVEVPGNILPYFELDFVTTNPALISTIHEGVDINIQFGKTKDTFEDIVMTCSKFTGKRQGQGKFRMSVKGYASKGKYLQNARTQAYGKVSGVEAVLSCVSKNFKPKFNIEKSDDSMLWIQAGESDRNFVFDTLMHSHRRNSFLGCAITGDGEFIVKDIKEELRKKTSKVDWTISNSSKDTGAFRFRADYEIFSQTGLVNAIVGYGRHTIAYGAEDGSVGQILEKPDVVMALSSELAKRADIEKKFAGTEMQNQNVHSNYWRAYQANLAGLLSVSAIKINLELEARYAKVRPLDVVMFKDTDLADGRVSSEYHSGIYLVSKVERIITGNKCHIKLDICRESFNQIRTK